MSQAKPMSFTAACKDFFGVKPGQTALDFMKEVKALTEADKAEIKAGLEANGYQINN